MSQTLRPRAGASAVASELSVRSCDFKDPGHAVRIDTDCRAGVSILVRSRHKCAATITVV